MISTSVTRRYGRGDTPAAATVPDPIEGTPPPIIYSLRGEVIIDLRDRRRDLDSLARWEERDPEIAAGRAEKAEQRARIAANVDHEATNLLAHRAAAKAAGVDPDTGERYPALEHPSDQPEQPRRYRGSYDPSGAAVTADGSKAPDHVCGRLAVFVCGGLTRRIRVECKTRGCPKCGDQWGLSWYDAAHVVYDQAPGGRWVEVEVDEVDADRWKSTVARYRKANGVDLRGISAPSGYSTRRYLLDLGDGGDLPEQWAAIPVDDPMERVQATVLGVQELAAARMKLPAEARQDLGAVSGLGSWREAVAEVRKEQTPESSSRWEFLGIVERDLPVEELIERAKDLGALVDADSDARCSTYKFPDEIARDRWLWPQRFVDAATVVARLRDRAAVEHERKARRKRSASRRMAA